MDTFSPEQRHRCMSNIRSKNTLPEILVRKRLFACGWRFRVCDKRFQGKPDIVIPKAKTIIDIRGCFWHRHGCKDSTMPKSNIAFWMEKWSKNVKRDHRNEKAWSEAGWNLIIVWQCALDGVKAGHTLERICSKIELWAAECAAGKTRRVPHRLDLPLQVGGNRSRYRNIIKPRRSHESPL
jgi:DNA mismatch endonuclease (patch repair protein)